MPAPLPFVPASDDPLALEHSAVAAWIEEAVNHLGGYAHYRKVELKSLPNGVKLLAADSQQSMRIVMAALAQVRHWDRVAAPLRAIARSATGVDSAPYNPEWRAVWSRHRQAEAVISTLMRRNLPFERSDLLELLQWCNAHGAEYLTTYSAPLSSISRALLRYSARNTLDSELREAVQTFAVNLRTSIDKQASRLAVAVEQLCINASSEAEVDSKVPVRPTPQPSSAGFPWFLVLFKQSLGMLADNSPGETTLLEPDRCVVSVDSPLFPEHELLGALFNEVIGTPQYSEPKLDGLEAGRKLLALEPPEMGRALLAAAERHINGLQATPLESGEYSFWQSRYAAASVAPSLLDQEFEFDRDGLFDFLLYLSFVPAHQRSAVTEMAPRMIESVTQQATASPLTEGERYVLWLFRASLVTGPALGRPSREVSLLTRLINDGASFFLTPGEAWSDAVNNDLSRLDLSQQEQWSALFRHTLSATASRPSARWRASAEKLLAPIGADKVAEMLARWFSLVSKGQTIRKLGRFAGDTRGSSDTISEENANFLRGLLWCVPLLKNRDELAHGVTSVALSAYKKVPGVGPRAVKVGNAAVYALSELASKEAVGHLAMLKVRVKFGSAQKEIEKAFTAAATALELPRDQIEELGVPSYGMEEIGRRAEEIGGYRAELVVNGSAAELKWSDASGKPLKSVPAKVKSEHQDDLKELQQALKDIQSMLPAQRDRIDGMFLLRKSWPITEWRERYYDHPLVGTIACRLVWCIDGTSAVFLDGAPTDLAGAALSHGKTAEITLWHPVGRTIDEVIGWRRRLEELGITQPFKQAHREVYLLTDAERNTQTYSNRFAAHILRQHQFNALCAARGWKNRLRLMVDDSYPPATKELSHWGLRAEFWIEGIGEDYGTDTNDSGVYLRLATDQVRFYRSEAAGNSAHAGGGGYGSRATGAGRDNINEPLPLEAVPPLVFSEVMRDVDLFVGVASLGNDPQWQDGGPEGRFQDYWNGYSFGELSTTASMRKEVLERLIPRLKIAARCSFSDRFLVVRGDKRTYKIHLGSGNILMEPNDQYLCIVPDARMRGTQNDLFLPFEGDATLSIIISKALLLAEDNKIKDPTITRQIQW